MLEGFEIVDYILKKKGSDAVLFNAAIEKGEYKITSVDPTQKL